MADKIRVGIVGATVTPSGSRWGANAHIPALRALPDYEMKAVATQHEESAKASAEAFGAELWFDDYDKMIAHPDVDLIIVCVRVPNHKELVMRALQAGKATFCEWPLGANLAEAEEMAAAAKSRSLRTAVGLQGRSDPAMMYARELIAEGYIGDVLNANLSVIGQAQVERTPDRIWQGERAAGANTLTIAGGHAIDGFCLVLGEFAEVTARVATQVKQWKLAGTNEMVDVDAPDSISVSGRLLSGAEVTMQVATVMSNPSGQRLEIYGSKGALAFGGTTNSGDRQIFATRGAEPMQQVEIPDRFKVAPEGTPSGTPRNVAQAYTRFADAFAATTPFDPDFDLAVRRHKLIDAIERSSAEGRSVKVPL